MSKLSLQPSLMKWTQKMASIWKCALRFNSDDASSTWTSCPKLKQMKGNAPICRTPESMRPKFFKASPDCKSDEELSKLPRNILGIPRCNPPFVLDKDCDVELYDPCKLERLDTLHYKPSRSLDRVFDRYWVECVPQKRPKRRCYTTPAEICRREKRKEACGWLGNVSKCKVLLAMSCNKLNNVSTTTSIQCPKHPLCECPKASKNTRCRLLSKPGQCRRRLTRYPSFSECLHDPLSQVKLNECRCMQGITLCEIWKAYQNYRRPCSPK